VHHAGAEVPDWVLPAFRKLDLAPALRLDERANRPLSVVDLDLARLYPMLVLDDAVPDAQRAGVVAVGHGISMVLGYETGGALRPLFPDDVAEIGLEPDAANRLAIENLHRELEAERIPLGAFRGVGGAPFVLIGPHWQAASCLVVPGVHEMATEVLGEGPILGLVPHRDVFYLFTGDAGAWRTFVEEHEADVRRPLSWGVFRVDQDGVRPL
jgi:hypothetical protein